ncbi:Rtr1/RPAP2 family-domain-containing protein [Chlamydoabsidia padenii]|nr:Rtr1/RPAP2 family-domain-containing protein [Chlamydoabsidia padenii]
MATKTAKPTKTTTRKQKMTVKQKIIQENAQQRQKIQKQVFAWQERLFTQDSVSATTLREATRWLQPQTYDEVVEERCVQSICGYPLCSSTPQEQESRYRISLSQRKVFDQSELASYCSLACLQKSKYYAMQLSEDPVWVRDLVSPISSTIHVIPLEDNFKQAVAQQKQQQEQQSSKSSQDLRREYVQKLLSNVPIGSNNNNNTLAITPSATSNNLEMTIVEKVPVPLSSNLDLSFGGIHDAIEGYRIENSSKTNNEPTTILLTNTIKSNPPPPPPATTINNTSTIIQENEIDLEGSADIDPDSLLDNAMETMMILKKLNLDRESMEETEMNMLPHTPTAQSTSDKKSPRDPPPVPPAQSKTSVDSPVEQSSKTKKSSATTSSRDTKAAVAAIEAAASAAAAMKAKKAKKRKEPEMSLFGKIWTMLDRMTTKSTRLYLSSLAATAEEGQPGANTQLQLLEEDGLTEDNYLRGHIFSEKILESYALVRSQLGIKGELEMDMVNLIRTFSFTDATMVVLDSNQTYMISLVLFKTLATLVLKNESGWENDFDICCRHIGQTSDMVDACVRVLKVAST